MSRKTFGIRLVCVIAACVGVAAPAGAQTERPMGGPFEGLFRGSPRDQPHTLDLRASGFAAWDDNLLAQAPGGGGAGNDATVVDPRYLKQGVAKGFQGAAMYGFRKNGTRSQFSVTADASAQQFASGLSDALWFYTWNASTSLRTKITSRTSFAIGVSSVYVPYYRYAPFLKDTASEESPVGADYGFAVQSQMVRTSSASASLEHRLTRRSAISAGIGWEENAIPGYDAAGVRNGPGNGLNVTPAEGQTADPNTAAVPVSLIGSTQRRSAQASFTHSLTRKLGFHVSYGVQENRYGASSDTKPSITHNLDIGLGYGDGITFTFGRQTLSLAIGVSAAKNGDPVSVAASGKSTAIIVGGNATLSRPLGRTWGTSLSYVRGTYYVVGFREPMMTDSANAGIGGPIFSRLHSSTGGGASRGQQLFSESGRSIISYTASTRLTFAMTKYLALYGQASYYRFSIPPDFANFGFVPKLDRRSASVGLSTWLPLIKQPRARRGDGVQPTTGQP